LSPIPLTDPLVIKGVNKLISITSGTDKPFQFFSNDKRTFNESMGVLGIPLENADVLFEMVEMGITGTYNVEFMGSLTKKELTSRDQDKLYLLFTSYLMYSVGMVPADIGPIIKKKLKLLKKGSAAEIKRLKKLNKFLKMANSEQNGWNEYSKLVIAELERLNDGITKLNSEIQDLKGEIKELKVKEDFAKELWKWKQAVDEVASPTQLKYTIKDVADLKTFKTQAITIWAVVQLITAAIITFFKLYK